MMKINRISSNPDRIGRYGVSFCDGTSLKLYPQTIEENALYSGKEFSEEEYDQLLISAGKMSAKMRAVRIISASNVSQNELEKRLVYKGEKPEDAQQAVQWMQELNLIDDLSTAKLLISKCIHKGYGLARARQVLYEKRIPKEYWDEVLKDYPEQRDAILDFLRSRLRDKADEKEIRRVTSALIRRGHSYQEIRRGLEALSVDDDFLED